MADNAIASRVLAAALAVNPAPAPDAASPLASTVDSAILEWLLMAPDAAAARRHLFGDLAAAKRFGGGGWTDWNDGHSYHAPVGAYLPNPWGFHDMQGNVSEWCADEFHKTLVDEEGERLARDSSSHQVWARSRRGVHFQSQPLEARSAHRHGDSPRGGNVTHGVRLARAVR